MIRQTARISVALATLAVGVSACGGVSDREQRPTDLVRLPSDPVRLLQNAIYRTMDEHGATVTRKLRATENGNVLITTSGRTRTDIEEAHVTKAYGDGARTKRLDYIYRSGIGYLYLPKAGRWIEQYGRFGLYDAFQFLPVGSDHVQRAGRERLAGMATSRVKGVLNIRRAWMKVDGTIRPRDRRFLERLERLGSARLPFCVWIDSRGRIRQIAFAGDALYFTSAIAGHRVSETTRLERFDRDMIINGPSPGLIVRTITGP